MSNDVNVARSLVVGAQIKVQMRLDYANLPFADTRRPCQRHGTVGLYPRRHRIQMAVAVIAEIAAAAAEHLEHDLLCPGGSTFWKRCNEYIAPVGLIPHRAANRLWRAHDASERNAAIAEPRGSDAELCQRCHNCRYSSRLLSDDLAQSFAIGAAQREELCLTGANDDPSNIVGHPTQHDDE